MSVDTRTAVRIVNRLILFITRHWVALVNAAMALILGLAFLAPWLMEHGYAGAGQMLYLLFKPTCHQLPERSFFVGGARPWYSLGQLTARLGFEPPLRFIGDAQLGYKVAVCERDVAIYAGWLLGGLAFGLLRRRIKQLPWPWFLAFLAPMAVDGLLQLSGVVESDWFRRSATGLLFGVGVIWLAFPWLEQGMNEARDIVLRSLEDVRAASG